MSDAAGTGRTHCSATSFAAEAALQLGVQGHCDGSGGGQTPYRPGDLGSGVATQLADVRSLGPPNNGPVWYRNGIECGVAANGTVAALCLTNFVKFAHEATASITSCGVAVRNQRLGII